MRCPFALARFDPRGERRGISRMTTASRRHKCNSHEYKIHGLGKLGLGAGTGLAAVIALGLAWPANAQVIPSTSEEVGPPWNAQRIFEPSSLPDLTDRDN